MSGKNKKPQQPKNSQQSKQQGDKKSTMEMKDGTILELLDFDPTQIALDEASVDKLAPKNAIINEIKEDINNQRKETLKKALEEYDNQLNTLKSIKPDVENYQVDGKSLGPIYSKDAYNKKKQALDRFENLKEAINEAWAGDFEKLEKMYKIKYK